MPRDPLCPTPPYIKVRSENLEPFSRNQDNSPDFKGICEFLFACCQECVEVYDKVFTENKNQKIRAKNAKIGFATTRKRHFREERSI